MLSNLSHRPALAGVAVAAALLAWTPADARVTKIVINTTADPDATLAPFGDAGPLKRITGRAFGELDPRDERNAIRSEEHTSELQSRPHLVCRLLLEKKKN